jgi:hypothetical protein
MNKLNDIPDKNPFKVPENYFEDVNRKILSAASGKDKEIRMVSTHSRLRTSLMIAASFAGLILIGFSALKLLAPDKKNAREAEVFEQMSPDSLIYDIDILSLEENASSLVLTDEGSGVSKKDIIDYLILDNIEVNEIYEKL